MNGYFGSSTYLDVVALSPELLSKVIKYRSVGSAVAFILSEVMISWFEFFGTALHPKYVRWNVVFGAIRRLRNSVVVGEISRQRY